MNKKTKSKSKKTAPQGHRETSIVKNGWVRPSSDGKTGKVWDIADKLTKGNTPAARADVLKEAAKRKLNLNMASTQYARWRLFHGFKGRTPAKPATTRKSATRKPAKPAKPSAPRKPRAPKPPAAAPAAPAPAPAV